MLLEQDQFQKALEAYTALEEYPEKEDDLFNLAKKTQNLPLLLK